MPFLVAKFLSISSKINFAITQVDETGLNAPLLKTLRFKNPETATSKIISSRLADVCSNT